MASEFRSSLTKDNWATYIHELQDLICQGLEKADGKAKFHQDIWQRNGGGGGRTRVMSHGAVFEKAGVNTSVVYGPVTDVMKRHLGIEGHSWWACGLSMVLHPENPFVPTTHANWRMFELYDASGAVIDRWFGGGADLTPYYLFEEDAIHFHTTLKNAIDPFGAELYPKFKKQCDEYFRNTHRDNEMRGIGGVFYDYLRAGGFTDGDGLFRFQQANGDSFLEAYVPIVGRRKNTAWQEHHRYWQEIRRGRYVEFNLIHDRGTIFGLKTSGRTESILMSLPPRVRFDYGYDPEPDSAEAQLLLACRDPRDWAYL